MNNTSPLNYTSIMYTKLKQNITNPLIKQPNIIHKIQIQQKKQHINTDKITLLNQSRINIRQRSQSSQYTSLEKQIDNLMIQNNNLRSGCREVGKYQLKLMQKQKQIKSMKQQYQSQITTLKHKIDSVNSITVSKSRNDVKQDGGCENCVKLSQQIERVRYNLRKLEDHIQQIQRKGGFYEQECKRKDKVINELELQIGSLKRSAESQQQIIDNLKNIQSNLIKEIQNKQNLSKLQSQINNQNISLHRKIQQLQNALRLQNKSKNQIVHSFQTYIKQITQKTNPNVQQKTQQYNGSNTSSQKYPQNNNYIFRQQISQLKQQINNLIEITSLRQADKTQLSQLYQQNMIGHQNLQRLGKQIERLNEMLMNKDKQLERLRKVDIINSTLSKRVESLQERNWRLIQQINGNDRNGLNSGKNSSRLKSTGRKMSSNSNLINEWQIGKNNNMDDEQNTVINGSEQQNIQKIRQKYGMYIQKTQSSMKQQEYQERNSKYEFINYNKLKFRQLIQKQSKKNLSQKKPPTLTNTPNTQVNQLLILHKKIQKLKQQNKTINQLLTSKIQS